MRHLVLHNSRTGDPASRVAAIDHHHTAAEFSDRGSRRRFRPSWADPPATPIGAAGHHDRGRGGTPRLTSHGWTQGMFSRRDRCLLVLSQVAGRPYQALATLTIGDIEIARRYRW